MSIYSIYIPSPIIEVKVLYTSLRDTELHTEPLYAEPSYTELCTEPPYTELRAEPPYAELCIKLYTKLRVELM